MKNPIYRLVLEFDPASRLPQLADAREQLPEAVRRQVETALQRWFPTLARAHGRVVRLGSKFPAAMKGTWLVKVTRSEASPRCPTIELTSLSPAASLASVLTRLFDMVTAQTEEPEGTQALQSLREELIERVQDGPAKLLRELLVDHLTCRNARALAEDLEAARSYAVARRCLE
jgi:hypothetical protein